MIKMQVIGHLGKDAEVATHGDKKIVNFSVAHTEKYKDKDGNKKERTVWVNCAYWLKTDFISQYLKKGTQVYVEGIPEAKAYAKPDGTPASNLGLRVDELQLLGSRNEQQPSLKEAVHNHFANLDINQPVDGLPF